MRKGIENSGCSLKSNEKIKVSILKEILDYFAGKIWQTLVPNIDFEKYYLKQEKLWFRVPTIDDYVNFCNDVIIPFFEQNHIKKYVDYAFYWSITSVFNYWKNKIRLWLSDIDIFVVYNTIDHCIDIAFITELHGEIIKKAKDLWIPIQIKSYTSAQMQNSVYAPDYSYLVAIKSCLVDWYCTEWIKNLKEINHKSRNKSKDELYMLRYFVDKFKNIWTLLAEVDSCIKKPEEEIIPSEQKILQELWDAYKKVISIMSTSILLKNNEYIFANSDREIVEKFREAFNDEWKDIEKVIKVFEKVQDIRDWFNFLKYEEWRCKILWNYYNNFLPFINAIWNKLNEIDVSSLEDNFYNQIIPKDLSNFYPKK